MSAPKRDKRIQTVISEEHHTRLLKLTEQYGKMNHVIEKGIDLINELGDPSVHSCDATRSLAVQQQMMDQGYIFLQQKFLSDFFESLNTGTIQNWINTFLNHLTEAANPLYSRIAIENTFQGLKDFLQQESEYMRLYLIVFEDEEKKYITLEPIIFPKHPELAAIILTRALDFLEFTYDVKIAYSKIEVYWIPETNYTTKIRDERQERFQKLFQGLNERFNEKIKLKTALQQLCMQFIANNETTKVFGEILFHKYLESSNSVPISIEEFEKYLKYLFEDIWGLGKVDFVYQDQNHYIITSNIIFDCDFIPDLLESSLNSYGLKAEHESCHKYNGTDKCSFILRTRSISILLVDDEKDVLDSLNREFTRFKSLSANILLANSGNEALKILENVKVDIIIADQKMSGMSGVDLLEKTRVRYPSIKRVLITGYGDTRTFEDAINKAHVSFFLKKPWDRNSLAMAIKLDSNAEEQDISPQEMY